MHTCRHNTSTQHSSISAFPCRGLLLLYVAFLVVLTFALVMAAGVKNPSTYSSSMDYGRGVLELIVMVKILADIATEIAEFYMN